MAEIVLNIPLVRDGKVKDFIGYLNELRREHSEISICRSLLKAVELEYISPWTLSSFIPWCKSLDIIVVCMSYPHSCAIRQQAIKTFGKTLSKPGKWEDMWKSIGGTQGLVDHLAKMSVIEVKLFGRILGSIQGRRIPARENAIEGLLRALIPSHYPKSPIRSHDKRPIQELYGKAVNACSAKFVAELLDAQDTSNPLFQNIRPLRLLKTHGELLKERVLDAISNGGKQDAHFGQYLQAFCYKLSTEPGPNRRASAPMAFSMHVLRMRADESKSTNWPAYVRESKVYVTLLGKCIKKNVSESKLRDVFALGLKLLKANPKSEQDFQTSILWHELTTRWEKSPTDYEDLLTQGIYLHLGGHSSSICQNVLRLSKKLRLTPSRLWDLLRLYCLHLPRKDGVVVDLSTATDLKALQTNQWYAELFYTLKKDHALRLLQLLQISFPQGTYLQALNGISILSNSGTTGPALLSTMLQRDSPEVQARVQAKVDELRKKSSTSREQADRGEIAVTATRFAIASGSLELYGETVTWMQRYVCEQPILQQVYGNYSVLTMEGIDLLSGIPNPLPEDVTLEQIAMNVEKANNILMTFNETKIIAKREPSFSQYDWECVSQLFGQVIERRAAHAKSLQKRLLSSDADMYAALWEKTLAMINVVNHNFLTAAHGPIERLIGTLPPTILTGVAKSMLASRAKRREKKDREPGDDFLERLSYKALLLVIKSDKPELAQKLVLETILDRPDASSWHRQFLSERFMRSLTAKQAQEMLLAFATAIGEKLEEQSYVNVGQVAAAASAPPQSIVKVTTIKYLAQLLDKASFISVDSAVDVLAEIFKASTHRDIRFATLNSLLSLLNTLCSGADQKWRSNPLVEKIMAALESVVPVIGSINERRPPTEVEWKEAKVTGILPQISDRIDEFPPLLQEFLSAPYAARLSGIRANLRTEFVQRFLLPTYKLSQEAQLRWTALFLEKHKAKLRATDLPRAPVIPTLWKIVDRFTDLVPQTVLDEWNDYIKMCISPPAALEIFNKSLKKNLEIRDTPEVQHWLSVFGEKITTYPSSDTRILTEMIYSTHIKSTIPNGITHQRVQEIIVEHASLILDSYDQHSTFWTTFVRSLRPVFKANSHGETDAAMCTRTLTWQQTCRPVLQQISGLLKARKQLLKQQGKLTVLPSTSLLEHWLLPYPLYPSAKDVEAECKMLAIALEKQLQGSLEGEMNILRWPRVADDAGTIAELLNTNEEKLRVARWIGTFTNSTGSERRQTTLGLNLVKVTLAMGLIENGRAALDTGVGSKERKIEERVLLLDGLRGVVMSWLRDESEDVREMAAGWVRGHPEVWAKIEKRDEGVVGGRKK